MSFRTFFSGVRDWYNDLNGATLTGAIDVIVVEQEDGTFVSSPFHVRFGKLGLLKARDKVVDIQVNGDSIADIHMKLDDNGAAFFVEGVEEGELEDPSLATSPLPTLSSEPEWPTQAERESVNRSLNFDAEEADKSEDLPDEVQVDNLEHPTATSAAASSSAIPRNKNKGPNRKKRKNRNKGHGRSSSKSSLKELIIASEAVETFDVTSPNTPDVVSDLVPLTMTSTPTADRSQDSLLLSRLPDEKSLGSFVVDEDDPRVATEAKDELSAKMGIAASAPIRISVQKPQYFSEPEHSPVNSPMGSRPSSPILSDTEYETRGHRGSISSSSKKQEEQQSWEWGQLPTSATPQHHSKESKNSELAGGNSKEHVIDKSANAPGGPGLISYLFGGQSSKKKVDDVPGMYLDDLEKADEEVHKIYLGSSRSRNDTISGNENEDTESGTGQSLPMSPHSVEGAIGYSGLTDEPWPRAEISLCGGLGTDEFSPMLFEQSRISFDDFVNRIEERPDLLSEPGFIVKMNDTYMKWESAAPIIMSHVLFGRSLPSDLIEKLKGDKKNKMVTTTTSVSAAGNADSQRKSSWWPFSSRKEKEEATNKMNPVDEEETSSIVASENVETTPTTNVDITVSQTETEVSDNVVNETTRKRRSDNSSSSEGEIEIAESKETSYKKTLRLTSELIKQLNLKKGANEIQFSVTTAYQGTTRCSCHVYLWNYTDKIVISDIDGTITKSDVLGHVLPIIGRDWAQSGVASLFTKIVNNGYHIVYLSARAIGQASITKEYLSSIKQGEVNLPDGPIFLNPTSLVNAFHREVIEKNPQEFKIACLRDIKRLFPETYNPFYAGYGNRVNDVWAYQAVGIPKTMIFTINPKGELRHELTNAFQTSYGSMASYADHLFPSTDATYSPSLALEFSNFTYWRDILPTITDNNDNSGSDQTDGKIITVSTGNTTAAIEINVDETDNAANQAIISVSGAAEVPAASDHAGQVTNVNKQI